MEVIEPTAQERDAEEPTSVTEQQTEQKSNLFSYLPYPHLEVVQENGLFVIRNTIDFLDATDGLPCPPLMTQDHKPITYIQTFGNVARFSSDPKRTTIPYTVFANPQARLDVFGGQAYATFPDANGEWPPLPVSPGLVDVMSFEEEERMEAACKPTNAATNLIGNTNATEITQVDPTLTQPQVRGDKKTYKLQYAGTHSLNMFASLALD